MDQWEKSCPAEAEDNRAGLNSSANIILKTLTLWFYKKSWLTLNTVLLVREVISCETWYPKYFIGHQKIPPEYVIKKQTKLHNFTQFFNQIFLTMSSNFVNGSS